MIRSGPAAHILCLLPQKSPSTYQVIVYLFFILQNYIFETEIGKHLQLTYFVLILLIWRYILISFLVYEVIIVTKTDTRDPLLQVPQNQEQYEPSDLLYCFMCNAIVLKTSYHCWRCNQCSHNLDHHCKYLNCCIAQANYFPFLRLLTIFIFYSLNFVILTYIRSNFDILMWGIFSGTAIELILAFSLFSFHIFLAWCYNGNTLTFYNKKSKKKPKHIELREETNIFHDNL